MSAPQRGSYDRIARRWLALAERRRAHFVELRDSGRWRHYYSAAELLEVIGEAARTRNEWAKVAGLSPQEIEALG